MQIISNDKINPLALTALVEGKVIPEKGCGPYAHWVQQGWNFGFDYDGETLSATMTGTFPHGTEKKSAVVCPEIKQILINENLI